MWIYFGLEADEEGRPKVQDAVICRLCKKSVSAKGGNTSNLLSHLKVHLPQRHLHVEVKKANSKPSGKDKDHVKLARLLPGNREVAACIYRYTVMLLSYQIPILNFPYRPTLLHSTSGRCGSLIVHTFTHVHTLTHTHTHAHTHTHTRTRTHTLTPLQVWWW